MGFGQGERDAVSVRGEDGAVGGGALRGAGGGLWGSEVLEPGNFCSHDGGKEGGGLGC